MAEATSPPGYRWDCRHTQSSSDPACCVEMLSSRVLCPMPYFPMNWSVWAQYCNGIVQMCIWASLSIVRHWNDVYNFIRATQVVQKSTQLALSLPHNPKLPSPVGTPVSCSSHPVFSGSIFWFGDMVWLSLWMGLEERVLCFHPETQVNQEAKAGLQHRVEDTINSLPSPKAAECDEHAIICNWRAFTIAWHGHNWPSDWGTSQHFVSCASPIRMSLLCKLEEMGN